MVSKADQVWDGTCDASKLSMGSAECFSQELFHAPPGVNIVLGNQGSRDFWQSFHQQTAEANVTFDIILDDGEHGILWALTC
jgi:hypothetical protein